MQIWTFLHILSMFAAVTVVVGAEGFATYAIRKRDLGALRAYFRFSDKAEAAGGILFIVGIVFGLISAISFGVDLLQGWLVLAYVLVIATIVTGFSTVPFLKKVKVALDANEGDEPGPELSELLASRIPLIASVISWILVALIIGDMVFRPTF